MTEFKRYRAALAIIGLGALLLVVSVTVPVLAKKKKAKASTRVITGAPVTFTLGQTEGNGNYYHQRTTATCPSGFTAIGYGGTWSPARADDSAGLEVLESAAFAGASVQFRVASDINNMNNPSTFTPQVVCRKG
jgi:hypothetical protein